MNRILKNISESPFSEESTLMIRMANEDDAPEILAIYAPYILDTAISFELKVPTESEFRARMRSSLKVAPWLVCEINHQIVGYAYGSKHREREAYQWSADVSVYVDKNYHRNGVGKILYRELLRMLQEMGYHNAFAGIALPNEASVCFHESFGFEKIGIYKSVGFKCDKWHDVGWWQKVLRTDVRPNPIRYALLNVGKAFPS